MIKLTHLSLLIALVGGLLLMRPPSVSACSCAELPDPTQLYDNVDIVFVGTATDFRRPSAVRLMAVELYDYFSPPLPRIRSYAATSASAEFEVQMAWKGLDSRAVTVLTSPSIDGCGIRFQPGERYLVFARVNAHGEISTHACSGTSQISFLDDNPEANASTQTRANLAYLEALTPIPLAPAEADSSYLWWLASGLAILAVGGWVVSRHRRRDQSA